MYCMTSIRFYFNIEAVLAGVWRMDPSSFTHKTVCLTSVGAVTIDPPPGRWIMSPPAWRRVTGDGLWCQVCLCQWYVPGRTTILALGVCAQNTRAYGHQQSWSQLFAQVKQVHALRQVHCVGQSDSRDSDPRSRLEAYQGNLVDLTNDSAVIDLTKE